MPAWRPRDWRESNPYDKYEPGFFNEAPRTIMVHDRDTETVDTGLVDKDGRAIHRRVMRPIGFVRFG